MTINQRLSIHIKEAYVHIERINDIFKNLQTLYPLDNSKLGILDLNQKDILDVLAFRFSKLQDLLGSKIFREYLIVVQYPIEDKSFLELLKELEKEGILDIDIWSQFRATRNSIAHDYPYDTDDKIDAINYLIENIEYLFDITKKIEAKIEIITKRD
jgi:hypothetical protein